MEELFDGEFIAGPFSGLDLFLSLGQYFGLGELPGRREFQEGLSLLAFLVVFEQGILHDQRRSRAPIAPGLLQKLSDRLFFLGEAFLLNYEVLYSQLLFHLVLF